GAMGGAEAAAGARGWARVIEAANEAGPGAEIGVAARLIGGGRFWGRDADKLFPAASTIKVPILVALARAADAGRLGMDDRLRMQPQDIAGGTGVLAWMEPDLQLRLRDFAYLMIAVSDNTATNVLLRAVGLDRVGQTIGELGMRQTGWTHYFPDRAPEPGEPYNYTTASDLVLALTAIATGTAASPGRCEEMWALLSLQQDRDRLARWLPPGVAYGGKTGTLDGVVHDCGLIDTPAGTLAVAALTWNIVDRYRAEATIGAIGRAMVDEAMAM
ncbi:MAG TPA: serine hydrolase, partial [Thermomicrobiales bacterium]|nr:serine hydrolase [Thermomicrobiales bacterium]